MEAYNRHPILSALTVNPQKLHGDHYDETVDNVRISGTYLHGELQDKAGFDIFSFVGQLPTCTGIYPVKVLHFNLDATLYIWNDHNGVIHGLVVENDDAEGIDFAIKRYNARYSYL